MVEGKSIYEWNHTSAIIATILNVNRDPKKTAAISPSAIHPHSVKKEHESNTMTVDQFADEIMKHSKETTQGRRPVNGR